jgi:hypothetical protein
VLSDPVSMCKPSGEIATEDMPLVWPEKTWVQMPDPRSQSAALPSDDPVTALEPSLEKATELMAPVCSESVWIVAPVATEISLAL